MILFPNAKVNVGLRVVEKRNDGYHNIETLFLPIGLNDVLEFVENRKKNPEIKVSGIESALDTRDNLVIRAWQVLRDHYKIPGVSIHLHKIIPVGAGLGGGSSDAAFMLKGLSEYFELGCSMEELEQLASTLGSDCAFFIRNKPAIGRGRGEILEQVEPDIGEYEILLVNPGIHVSTVEAYQGVVPAIPSQNLREMLLFPVTEWQQKLSNDFEESVFKKYPQIEVIKEKLSDAGATYTAMSGSGSSVFGIFRKNGHSVNLKELFPGCFTWSGDLV